MWSNTNLRGDYLGNIVTEMHSGWVINITPNEKHRKLETKD